MSRVATSEGERANREEVEMMSNRRRLKIAFVSDSYNGSRNGAVVSTQRFVERLGQRHDVKIVTAGSGLNGKQNGNGRVSVPGFHLPGFQKLMEKMYFTMGWPKKEILRATFADRDIVHVQFPFYLGVQSLRLASAFGLPVVSSFHVQAEHLCYNVGVRSETAISAFYSLFLKTLYNKSDAVICPSRFAQEELTRYGLTAPSYVISNGITPAYRPGASNVLAEHRDRFIILSVGRLAREKRQDVIMEAIAGSRYREKIQLVLCGAGPQRENLERKGRGLPNPPLFLAMSPEELIPYYNAADLYVHASEVEIECLAVLEAMACGLTPVICDSEKSAAKQFALDDRSLFPRNDARHLAKKIDYWIENRQALEDAGRRYVAVAKAYDIEKSVRELEDVYYRLCGT